MTNVDAFLTHHGIKGMKWGIRRSRQQLGYKDGDEGTSSGKPSTSAENLVKVRAQSPDTHEFTNQEVQDAINRYKVISEYNKVFESKKPELERLNEELLKVKIDREKAKLKEDKDQRKIKLVAGLIKSASSGFDAYKTLNDISGGNLSAAFTKEAKKNRSRDAFYNKKGEAMTRDYLKQKAKEAKTNKKNEKARKEQQFWDNVNKANEAFRKNNPSKPFWETYGGTSPKPSSKPRFVRNENETSNNETIWNITSLPSSPSPLAIESRKD